MIVKVCGMRDPENIRAVERETAPDWMGFICWTGSKRFIADTPAYMPGAPVKRVGVFVRPTIQDVCTYTERLQLDLIQLHGGEDISFCREVKAAAQRPLVKAFSISGVDDIAVASAFSDADVADYLLFDTRTPLVGGSGKHFDWNMLQAYVGHTPFLLSGGISPADIPSLRQFTHPRWTGIDLNSRFETAPAMKDVAELKQFIQAIRNNYE